MAAQTGLDSDFRGSALELRPPRTRQLPTPPPGWEHNLAWRSVAIGERLVALALLVLCLPLLCVAGIVVCALSGRSPLVAHARVGRRGKKLWVLKIRTMWDGAGGARGEDLLIEKVHGEPPPEIKRECDPRITHLFASICRKYSIDELPQLWHVVMGDMALVGPRPLTAGELMEHYGSDAYDVLSVKPGLTGLWQVRGRSRLNYRQRRRFDLLLVRNWSLRLYVSILLDTVPKVLTGKDAW